MLIRKQYIPKYISLFVVIIISLISLLSNEIFNNAFKKNNNDPISGVSLLIPGIAFSFFIIFHQRRHLRPKMLVAFFLSLLFCYIFNIYISFSSYGLAVPVAGGLGAALIQWIIDYGQKKPDYSLLNFVLIGFLSSLAGLVFYYKTKKYFGGNEIGFAVIIIIWQISIGIKYFKQMQFHELVHDSKV